MQRGNKALPEVAVGSPGSWELMSLEATPEATLTREIALAAPEM